MARQMLDSLFLVRYSLSSSSTIQMENEQDDMIIIESIHWSYLQVLINIVIQVQMYQDNVVELLQAIRQKDAKRAFKQATKIRKTYQQLAFSAAKVVKDYNELNQIYQDLLAQNESLKLGKYKLTGIDKSGQAAQIIQIFVLLSNRQFQEAFIESKKIRDVDIKELVTSVWNFDYLVKYLAFLDNIQGNIESIPNELASSNLLPKFITLLFEGKTIMNSEKQQLKPSKPQKIKTTQILQPNEQEEQIPFKEGHIFQTTPIARYEEKPPEQQFVQRISELEQQNRRLSDMLHKQSLKISHIRRQSCIPTQGIIQNEEDLSNFTNEKSLLELQIKSLTEVKQNIYEELKIKEQLIKTLQEQKRRIEEKLINFEKKNQQLERKLEKQKETSKDLNIRVNSLNKQIEINKKRDQQAMEDFRFKQDTEKHLIQELSFFKQQVQEVKRNNAELRNEKEKSEALRSKLESNINELKKQNRKIKEDTESLKGSFMTQIRAKEDQIFQLSRKMEELVNAEPKKQRVTEHLFTSGDLLEGYEFEREELISKLQDYMYPIKKTKLIYRLDPLNRVNFHKYIDNHMHIVLVAKTIYGRVIAAYSEECFTSKGTKKGDALLMALWNQKVYEIKKTAKGVTYDDYFMIFGNSEIRIKFMEAKVFSNFGINNGYFQNKGDKIVDFLGEPERQVELLGYEIYELYFQ